MTKITAPHSVGIVPRKRAFKLLDAGLRRTAVWIAGPAGSGKTALVASYLAARRLRCLWYRADAGDGDPATFFYYMGRAAKAAAPRFHQPLPLLTAEYLMGVPVFARRYFEALYKRLKPPCAIVFDDYHEIPADSPLHEIMSLGLAVVPPELPVIILSRNAPPPAYARSLAGNRIKCLGWEDVRLTELESNAIVRAREERKPSHETLSLLYTKTEGWVAGLVLLTESLRSQRLDLHQLSSLTPGEIYQYFATEILRKTDREEQEFLLTTAFLPSLTARMAEALTGNKGAGRILQQLSDRGYFTVRHNEDRPAFRYHPLFREFLAARAAETFPPEKLAAIRREAASLLVYHGMAEAAAALFIEAADWRGLTGVIQAQAPAFIAQGRNQALAGWLDALPETMRQSDPWLLYWKGVCLLSRNPTEGRRLLEHSHQVFKDGNDDTGALVSWAGAVDASFFDFDDARHLDPFIDWLDERTLRHHSYPSPEIEARVAAAMSHALLWRRPDHPRIGDWMRRASALARDCAAAALPVNAPIGAALYYSWMGETTEHRIALDRIMRVAEAASAPALVKIAAQFMAVHFHMQRPDALPQAFQAAAEGLALADDTGVHVLDATIVSQLAFAALIAGDRSLTEKYLTQMESVLGPGRRAIHGVYHTIRALHDLNAGNAVGAVAHAEHAVTATVEIGVPFPEATCRVVVAQTAFETGAHQQAARELSQAEAIFARTGCAHFEYTCHLTRAHFAFELGQEGEARALLGRAFKLAKAHGYTQPPYFWRKEVMSRLCLKALEAGIEVDCVRGLVRTLQLTPAVPPVELDTWPWPIRIHTLGRFEIWNDDRPLEFSVKAPRRIITLLKLLVACGRTGAGEERLADLLWPEADGDTALQSLSTGIHRLRQLLGNDKAIQRRDGRIRLDVAFCWVDAHAFEELLDRAEGGAEGRNSSSADAMIGKALRLFKGAFLGDAGDSWAISYRERLRDKYLGAVRKLGGQFERRGQFDRAIECYRQGLECDSLTEEFHYRIMQCFSALGRRAEAIAVYRSWQRLLQAELGIAPSPETEAVYRALTK